MQTIIIQKENKEFIYDFCYEAYQSFSYLNWYHGKKYKIKFLSIKQLTDLYYEPQLENTICIGSIEFIHLVLIRLNVQIPKPINVPPELGISKFGTIKDLTFPCFIKPTDEIKLFDGTVIENKEQFKLIPELKSDTRLLIQGVQNYLSEYRCFVYKGKLMGIKHYQGDFELFPELDYIKWCINNYKNSPIAYTIDFGIVVAERNNLLHVTKLIEVHNFYSCGTYGFGGKELAYMLIDSWNELLNNNRPFNTIK